MEMAQPTPKPNGVVELSQKPLGVVSATFILLLKGCRTTSKGHGVAQGTIYNMNKS